MLVSDLKTQRNQPAQVLLCEALSGRYVHFYLNLPYKQVTYCGKVWWRVLQADQYPHDEICPHCLRRAPRAIQKMAGGTPTAPVRRRSGRPQTEPL